MAGARVQDPAARQADVQRRMGAASVHTKGPAGRRAVRRGVPIQPTRDMTKGPMRALRMQDIEVSRETSPAWTLPTGFPFHASPVERYSGSPHD
jgi:hypothetical protein